MAKLTKEQSKAHQRALDLVESDRALSVAERVFVLENYQESQGQLNALAGAFFTPSGLARDLAIEVPQRCRIVDLCAGIGVLAFWCSQWRGVSVTCVEQCPEYVRVGRRVLPDAAWVQADVFAADLPRFDFAVSNPPFGRVQERAFRGAYTGGEFEFKVIERASQLAPAGAFILPQQSAPFRYSGQRHYTQQESDKLARFRAATGIELTHSCGIDTSIYQADWHGVAPLCEVVLCDFPQPAAQPMNHDLFAEAA